jgi:hypothetical protein
MSKTKFLVSWIEGEVLGLYEAEDADGAILAAVIDAGYASLERAKDFIYDEKGDITIQAVPNVAMVGGKTFDMDVIASYMDDEIREDLHTKMAPCAPQEFVNAYIDAHEEKFGEIFAIN